MLIVRPEFKEKEDTADLLQAVEELKMYIPEERSLNHSNSFYAHNLSRLILRTPSSYRHVPRIEVVTDEGREEGTSQLWYALAIDKLSSPSKNGRIIVSHKLSRESNGANPPYTESIPLGFFKYRII